MPISRVPLTLFTFSLVISTAVFAQAGNDTPTNGNPSDGKANFNAANPGGATVNANGRPIGDGSKVLPNSTSTGTNLSNGSGINPYTGVTVGQPLRPNDIGRER